MLKPGIQPGDALVKELQDFVKAQIAPYKYPREIEFVAALPRTDTGKLQRFRLREHMEPNPEPILPAGWPRPSGYSNAMAASGRLVVLAGQIGWDPLTRKLVGDDFVSQARPVLPQH